VILLAAALTLASGSPVADALSGRGARFLVLGLLVAPAVALIAVSPLGRLSGAHTNPAVTLAFWVLGRVSRQDLAGYVVAQFVGGVAGAALGRLVLPAAAAEAIAGAVTHPSVPASEAVAVEVAMTGALLVLILAFVSHERLARRTPLAIVPLLATLILARLAADRGEPESGPQRRTGDRLRRPDRSVDPPPRTVRRRAPRGRPLVRYTDGAQDGEGLPRLPLPVLAGG
jgi:glycerol uptake facilitator-like aquaporin